MKRISKFISHFFKKTISEEMIREVKREAEALYLFGHSIKQPTGCKSVGKKKIISLVFFSLLMLSGCSEEDWFGKTPGEDTVSSPQGQPDNPTPPIESPFEHPTLPPPSSSQIERIKNLPQLSISFDEGFESIKPEGSIWRFNVNERNSFYENSALKIARFHISNFSDQDIKVRFGTLKFSGNLRQYLNKWVFKSDGSLSNLESLSYWMPKNLDISNHLKISFDNAGSVNGDADSYDLLKGDTLSGYLTIDLLRVPTCHIPKFENHEENGWTTFQTFRLLRVQMNFKMRFDIEKSILGEPAGFYAYREVWIKDPMIESKDYFLQSDLINRYGSLYDMAMSETNTVVEERAIQELSCRGLYLESPEEK